MNVACRPCDGGDLAHDEPERHHAVGHRQRVGVAQVDLLLARGVLVEAVLDRDAHRLERADRLLAQRAGDVVGREVEEAALVERLRPLAALGRARSRRTRCPARRRTSGPARGAPARGGAAPGGDRRRTACRRGCGCRRTPAPRAPWSRPTAAARTCRDRGSPGRRTPGCARSPSIDEPSNVIPSSSAFSSSAGLMAKLLRLPRMSVNQRRIRRTPRSSTLRRTYSRCWSCISFTPPVWSMDRQVGQWRHPGRTTAVPPDALAGRSCGRRLVSSHRRAGRVDDQPGRPRTGPCWRSGGGPRGSPCRP